MFAILNYNLTYRVKWMSKMGVNCRQNRGVTRINQACQSNQSISIYVAINTWTEQTLTGYNFVWLLVSPDLTWLWKISIVYTCRCWNQTESNFVCSWPLSLIATLHRRNAISNYCSLNTFLPVVFQLLLHQRTCLDVAELYENCNRNTTWSDFW